MDHTADKKTLLVVDDDPAILKFLSDLLVADFWVLTAASGENALQQAKIFQGQIHLLLTDITMPRMNGIALATRVTAQYPAIKVVLMSGSNGEMLMPNKEWHYLPKPFRPSHLITLVHDLVSSPQSKFAAV